MKHYDSFSLFWNDFSVTQANSHGFNDWQVVQILHTSDKNYAAQQKSGADELGFQPLIVTLANPVAKKSKKILVKNVDDSAAIKFADFCRNLYVSQFDARFGNFTPDTFHAFAEYDNWESFYATWLERDTKPVFMHNIPLLFDHTPKVEHWSRKQTGQEVLPYQRLLITTYFVSKDQFFDFFIKDVSDQEFERIKLLTKSRIGLHSDLLFKPGNQV